MRLRCFIIIAGLVMVTAAGGCRSEGVRQISTACTSAQAAESGQALAERYIREAVKPYLKTDGLYDYAAAKAGGAVESLNCYLNWAGRVSLESNPEIFGEAAGRHAFYLNVYAAGSLRAAIEFYPVPRVSKCPVDFDRGAAFTVAGQAMTLEALAKACGAGEDWRVAFALPRPALGGPFYRPVVFVAEQNDEQLNEAVRDYISSCAGIQFDYAKKRVVFGELLWRNRERFCQQYEQQYKLSGVSLIAAVAPWALPGTQKWLADSAGFDVGAMGYNDEYNDIDRKDKKKDKNQGDEEKPRFLPCGCH